MAGQRRGAAGKGRGAADERRAAADRGRGSRPRWAALVGVLLVAVAVCGGCGGSEEAAAPADAAGSEAAESTASTDAADALRADNAAAVEEANASGTDAESAGEADAGKADAGDDADQAEPAGGVNADSFAAIENGMSYEEVAALMGSEGELASETEAGGSTSQLYQWESDGWGIAQVMFMDDKVVNKTQIGIGGDSAAAVTADQYERVKEGMSYEDVVGIMGGEGQLISDTSVAGESLQIYTWDGETWGSNCTISFSNAVVDGKSQIGLE